MRPCTALKFSTRPESGSDSDVIGGLQFVLGKTAIRVVNMSLGRDRGTDEEDAPMQAAIKALYDAGVSVVVSAGNDAAKEISSQVPARFPEVLAIASTTAAAGANAGCRFYSGAIAADTASFFTTDGAGVAVSAPGDEKRTSAILFHYWCWSSFDQARRRHRTHERNKYGKSARCRRCRENASKRSGQHSRPEFALPWWPALRAMVRPPKDSGAFQLYI
jgi:hypothetical protein